MILALLAFGSPLQATFSPALIFPGERFRVEFSQPVELTGFSGVRIRGKGALYSGAASGFAPSFWAVWSHVDAARYDVPVAEVPRWGSWPAESGHREGVAFLVEGERKIALVPMKASFGICLLSKGKEMRFADVVSLDVAVRYGPRHTRPFRADYLYSGKHAITFTAHPEAIAHLSGRVLGDSIEVRLSADYEMSGDVIVLGKRFPLEMRKGETVSFSTPF